VAGAEPVGVGDTELCVHMYSGTVCTDVLFEPVDGAAGVAGAGGCGR
jgi:hypothetical protein